jgi:hypothetical protein
MTLTLFDVLIFLRMDNFPWAMVQIVAVSTMINTTRVTTRLMNAWMSVQEKQKPVLVARLNDLRLWTEGRLKTNSKTAETENARPLPDPVKARWIGLSTPWSPATSGRFLGQTLMLLTQCGVWYSRLWR